MSLHDICEDLIEKRLSYVDSQERYLHVAAFLTRKKGYYEKGVYDLV
jgi:hypothetical protein